MSTRHRLRELAVQVLFQHEYLPIESVPDCFTNLQDQILDPSDNEQYAVDLVTGVLQNLETIDQMIQRNSAHWKISRMAKVDLSILRVSVFEMKFLKPALSPGIAINEAVEIAKKFGSTDSASFVNGVLDQINKLEN